MKKNTKKKNLQRTALLVGVALLVSFCMIFALSLRKDNECINYNNKKYCTENYTNLKLNESKSKAIKDGLSPVIYETDGKKSDALIDIGGKRLLLTVEDGKVVTAKFE